jgi:tRNA modification GTPase
MRRAVVSDTIYALSSGQGRAGVAVVRLSGPAVRDVFQILCGKVPPERMATLMTVRHQGDADIIDKGLGLCFLAPRSFTGEDMGEFQLHGGRAVVTRLLDALSRIEGLRPAEAGEFTKRAFLNGKLDLVEVEGLGDVVSADTEGQLKLAQRLARGGLSERVALWRNELVSAMSLVEAAIDFSDEADVTTDISSEGRPRVKAVLAEIEAVLDDGGRGERLRDGVVVAIAGPPNAGKSTLLNLLARREAAIVSPVAGTTRDPVEVHLELGGVPVTLVDTAGLREGGDVVEAMGVARARERVAKSDLVLWLEPVTEKGGAMPAVFGNSLRVATKLDLAACNFSAEGLAISAVTGAGISDLLECLVSCVRELAGAEESILITRARQRAALLGCAKELRALWVGDGAADSGPEAEIELEAEHLRRAMRALGRLVGQVDVEEVLAEIFAAFCIGK